MKTISIEQEYFSFDGEPAYYLEAKIELDPEQAEIVKNIGEVSAEFYYKRQDLLAEIYEAAEARAPMHRGPGREFINECRWTFFDADPPNVITINQNGGLDI